MGTSHSTVGLLTLLRVTTAIEPVTSVGEGSLTLKATNGLLPTEGQLLPGPSAVHRNTPVQSIRTSQKTLCLRDVLREDCGQHGVGLYEVGKAVSTTIHISGRTRDCLTHDTSIA